MKNKIAWLGWILLIVFVTSQYFSQSSYSQTSKSDTWEYTFFEDISVYFGSGKPDTLLVDGFKKLGQEGWEIVDSKPAFQTKTSAYYLFKRKKK